MQIKISVSLISLLLSSLLGKIRGQGALTTALRISKDAGLDGLEILPVTYVSMKEFERLNPTDVVSWSGRWGQWKDYVDNFKLVMQGKSSPFQQLFNHGLDFTLFGFGAQSKKRELLFERLFEGIPFSSHDPEKGAYEVKPEDRLSIGGLFEMCDQGRKFTIDTYHIFRHGWRGELPIARIPEDLVAEFARRNAVQLLHLQIRNKGLLNKFLNGEDTVEASILYEAFKNCRMRQLPVTIELPPQWLTNEKVAVELLARIAERIRKIASYSSSKKMEEE